MSYNDFKSGSPVLLVDLVPEAHGVDHGELEPHVALLELVGVGLELHSGLVVLSGLALELGVEQGVHEGGLPQPGLPFRNTGGQQAVGHCGDTHCTRLILQLDWLQHGKTPTTLLTIYLFGGLNVHLLHIPGIHANHLEFKSKDLTSPH